MKLLRHSFVFLAVIQVKQNSLCKENNMETGFNSMAVYMKRSSEVPDSCVGWAHTLWNVAEKAGEQRPQISHMWYLGGLPTPVGNDENELDTHKWRN